MKANPAVKVTPKVILGIDPGSTFTGFGVVTSKGDSIVHVSHGVIAPPAALEFNERIAIVASELESLLERVRPDVTVIEKIFMGKNADSAFKLGHVRGITVAAALRADSLVVEYATRSVKKGITGNGSSTKEQVQTVLFAALGIRSEARLDASDALALAFYHARNVEVLENLGRGGQVRRNLERTAGGPVSLHAGDVAEKSRKQSRGKEAHLEPSRQVSHRQAKTRKPGEVEK